MRDYDGKTATERVAERRKRLIDAGIYLFGENGYSGTSIRAVLRQAGLIDRYFAETFADLDSLLAAVYAQLIEEEIAECRTAINGVQGSSEGARAMIEAIVESYDRDPASARIKLREVHSGGPIARKERRRGLYELSRLVADLLPPTPTSSDRNRRFLAKGIVAAADELLSAWLDGERELTREAVVELVTLHFVSVENVLTRHSSL